MTAEKSAVESLADEWESWWPPNHVGDVPRGYAKALREAIAADQAAGRPATSTYDEARAWQDNYGGMFARWAECDAERLEWKRRALEAETRERVFREEVGSAYARGRDEALAEVEMRLADDGIGGTTIVRELREGGES